MNEPSVDALQLHDAGVGAERILAELAAIRADVQGLRAMLAERERIPASRLHLRMAAPLLAEISAAVGDVAWTVRELFDFAASDAPLRAAIATAIGPPGAGATRRIGRLLARCEGLTLPSGYRVERVDDDRPAADCATWRIVR